MNDILAAKASFADQATIFRRSHNWLMCWLYTGTFGTFIGMSAGFPLVSRMVFPDVPVHYYAFLGPLVGALARAGSGWIADRYGGARDGAVDGAEPLGAVGGAVEGRSPATNPSSGRRQSTGEAPGLPAWGLSPTFDAVATGAWLIALDWVRTPQAQTTDTSAPSQALTLLS